MILHGFDAAPLWTEVDLDALRDNLRRMRAVLTAPTEIIAVVKADAYGHGAPEVVRVATTAGVRRFAVVHPHEALAVRAIAPEVEVLLIGPIPPDFAPVAAREHFTVAVVDLDHGRALSAAAVRAGVRLPVHIKVDTGMGRLGFAWETAVTEAGALFELPGLDPVGVLTHFARVGEGAHDPADVQAARFRTIAATLEARAGRRLFKHVSSSRAFLLHPECDFDGVRPGIALYGYGAGEPGGRFRTRPVLQWKTRVAQVRHVSAGFPVGYDSTYVTPGPTTLAILAVGYSDGYFRALSGKGIVLIGGRRCPVRGRVSMNWLAMDAGPDARVAVGDEAVLIGRQGGSEIWADELAERCGTLPHEILTNARGVRRYIAGGAVGAPAMPPTPAVR